jgi:hypothetical protein
MSADDHRSLKSSVGALDWHGARAAARHEFEALADAHPEVQAVLALERPVNGHDFDGEPRTSP